MVQADLQARIKEEGLEELFGDVLVPKGKSAQHYSAADALPEEEKKEKIFPGYLLVQMEMTGDSYRIVSAISRVTRFLGGETPMPLSEREVERIYSQMEGRVAVASVKPTFIEGSEVQIANGPFVGFVGLVEKVDEVHEKLTVMVSIFGRLTPVELGFDQVKL